MSSKVLSTIAFVAFTFFVTVDGDSRDEYDRCNYSPRGVREAWKPSEEGEFNVKFFVPLHRWGHHEEYVPLTLGLEWGYIGQQNALRKTRYTLEPSRGAAAGPRSPSKATRLPHNSLLLGWNELPLTWHNTSGNISTLTIGNFKTEVNIGPHDQLNITVEGMTSFLNCEVEGGRRYYRFNSSYLWRNQIIPFYWEQNGDQYIWIVQPSLLSFSTHSRGQNVTFCRLRNETQFSVFWYMRRACPPPIWREYGEGDQPWQIRIKGFNIDLEEEEDYLVVKGNWSFLQLDVKYTRREGEKDGAGIYTWYQRSVDVIYEDVFPSGDEENTTTALPNTTAVPITTPTVCSGVTHFCPPDTIFNYSLLFQRLKEREEELSAARMHIEQLMSGYINYEDLCTSGSEQALNLGTFRTPSHHVSVVTEDQQPRASTVYNESPPADDDLTPVTRDRGAGS